MASKFSRHFEVEGRNGQAEFLCENVSFVVQYINVEGLYCGVNCSCSSNSTHKVLKIPINDSLNLLNTIKDYFYQRKELRNFFVFMKLFFTKKMRRGGYN